MKEQQMKNYVDTEWKRKGKGLKKTWVQERSSREAAGWHYKSRKCKNPLSYPHVPVQVYEGFLGFL